MLVQRPYMLPSIGKIGVTRRRGFFIEGIAKTVPFAIVIGFQDPVSVMAGTASPVKDQDVGVPDLAITLESDDIHRQPMEPQNILTRSVTTMWRGTVSTGFQNTAAPASGRRIPSAA